MHNPRTIRRLRPAIAAVAVTAALLTGCGAPGTTTAAISGTASVPAGAPSVPAGAAASVVGFAAKPASPGLATGAAAKRIVNDAILHVNQHGPFRLTVSDGKTTPLVAEIVPPSSEHAFLSTASGKMELVQIGKRGWIRSNGVWRQGTTTTSTNPLPATDKDLVSATEKPSTDRRVRIFAVVIKASPKNVPGTVRLERSTGRLLGLSVNDPASQTTMPITIRYDPKIKVTAPKVG